jgi:hypothetical protein
MDLNSKLRRLLWQFFLVFTRNYDAYILLSARASCMPSSHQVFDFLNVAHL